MGVSVGLDGWMILMRVCRRDCEGRVRRYTGPLSVLLKKKEEECDATGRSSPEDQQGTKESSLERVRFLFQVNEFLVICGAKPYT
ncbi:hypothetical protein Baya_0057 [Bagarius yarrelli]|uniref:Uncharacterized protein n=1 Tax=Bagarius yarrelli TaxID=175774 RepID=A0A556TH69_BAGYA|nr:hypothetical protein Baya_0057 [Bagarius yarrelli]